MMNVIEAIEDIVMVNQVNDSAGLKTIELDSRMKAKNQKVKEHIAENVSSPDSVNFSDTSKQLEAIKNSFKDEPEVNAAKVAHLKSEIDSGNYKANSEQIAKKILNNYQLA